MNIDSSAVAIIILNWNGYEDTFECIQSLEFLDYQKFHVFLIDNDSSDGSYEKLLDDISKGNFKVPVSCIQTGANLGCAGGNNAGLKTAFLQGYEYFWMLNNDTIVDAKALSALMEVMEEDPQIGIIGSKIYFSDTNILWYAGGGLTPHTGATSHYGYFEEDYGKYEEMKEVGFVVGCSMLFRRKLIEEIGFLEEKYFLMFEDTDFNLKARINGWKIVYNPKSIIYHKESSSTKADDLSPYFGYYLLRNGYLMVTDIYPKYKWLACIYLLIRLGTFHYSYVLKSKKNKRIKSAMLFKAVMHAIKQRKGQYLRGVSHARKREYI